MEKRFVTVSATYQERAIMWVRLDFQCGLTITLGLTQVHHNNNGP